MTLAEFALSAVASLIAGAIQATGVSYANQGYFKQRKIKNSLEDAVADVVEPLLPFLDHEGVREAQQRLLF